MPEESGDVLQGLIDVGDSIRNLRTSQQLTLEQLSARTRRLSPPKSGVGVSTIKELERHEKVWTPRESTLGDLAEALGLERSHLSQIRKGFRPRIEASEPKRMPEDYLEEISKRISGLDEWRRSVDKRLERIDTTLGLAPRPDEQHPNDLPKTGD